MGQLRNALRAFLIEGRGPADALAHLDALMLHIELDQMATAAVAVFDPDAGRLVYSLAGHPPPLLAVDGEAPRLLEEGRTPPLGVLRGIDADRGGDRHPGAASRSCSTPMASPSGARSPST